MPITGSSRSGDRDLYERFVQLSRCASVDERQRIKLAIADYPDILPIVREYCKKVRQGRRRRRIVWEDLVQATYCRFLDALINDKLHYCDQGLQQFWSWFRAVIETDAKLAALVCERPWTRGYFLVDPRALAGIPSPEIVVIDGAEVVAAIDAIDDPKTREVVRRGFYGQSVAQIAEALEMTERDVRRRRRIGHRFVRQYLFGE
jgi:hypothetical protein